MSTRSDRVITVSRCWLVCKVHSRLLRLPGGHEVVCKSTGCVSLQRPSGEVTSVEEAGLVAKDLEAIELVVTGEVEV